MNHHILMSEHRLENIRKKCKEGEWDFQSGEVEELVEHIDALKEVLKSTEALIQKMADEKNALQDSIDSLKDINHGMNARLQQLTTNMGRINRLSSI